MADILPSSHRNMDGLRDRWGAFAFSAENDKKAQLLIGRYPPGRQQSAIIPLFDLAQRQVGAETTATLGAMDIVFGECDR